MFRQYWITNPYLFYGAGAAIMAYLLAMMIRPRKGERPGGEGGEPEL